MVNTQEYFSSVFYQLATNIHIKCKHKISNIKNKMHFRALKLLPKILNLFHQ